MNEFSTVDGFVDICEYLAEMIKYVAHEPSVGLFFIQQHCQKAVPNVIINKTNIVEKCHEIKFHTEDLDDSLTMVKTMKECGISTAEDMIADIKAALVTTTTKQPRELSRHLSMRKKGSWGSFAFYSQEGSESSGSYFSSIFRSASSTNLLHPQLDISGAMDSKNKSTQPYNYIPLPAAAAFSASSLPVMETDEHHLSSSHFLDAPQHFEHTDIGDKLLSVAENYDDLMAIKEAQLEIWLEGTSKPDVNISGQADDAEKH